MCCCKLLLAPCSFLRCSEAHRVVRMKRHVAALYFFLRAAMASLEARVENQCPFPVYLQSVQTEPSEIREIQPGNVYSEGFKPVQDGTGVSIKIAMASLATSLAGPITQFEYAFVPWQTPNLFYDISSINDEVPRQFCQHGLTVRPSSAECAPIVCSPGCLDFCSQVYNKPDDDFATTGCNTSGDITLVLCG